MKIHKYISLIRNAFRQATAYRLDALASFGSSLIFLVLYIAVWTAISEAGDLEGGLSLVVSYLVAGQIVSNVVSLQTEKYFGVRIRNGTIVNELKRPISMFKQTYFHELGWALFNFISKSVPVAVIGIIFLDVTRPGLINGLVFLLSVFLAFNLVFLLAYSVSMLVFWTRIDWSVRMMRNIVQNLFSGVLFPLYLLPDALGTIFYLLPFHAMADSPIRIFIMDATGFEIVEILLIQVFWIFVMYLFSLYAWSKARRKLTVQGG